MFESGPYVSCYRAEADGSFAGVRCVKFANLVHCPDARGVAFVWYAEGVDTSGPYRYFGEAFVDPAGGHGNTLYAHAGGITGNGEDADSFLRLLFDRSSAPGTVPNEMSVSGDRHERWTLVPDGVIRDHTPLPRHIERSGPRLHEFRVHRDGTPGFGIRSMLSSGSWLGAGRWLDLTYLHLGTYIRTPTGDVRYGVADIAAGNHYCNYIPWGELAVQADPEMGSSVLHTSGTWSETWRLRHAATGWRPDPRIGDITGYQ